MLKQFSEVEKFPGKKLGWGKMQVVLTEPNEKFLGSWWASYKYRGADNEVHTDELILSPETTIEELDENGKRIIAPDWVI